MLSVRFPIIPLIFILFFSVHSIGCKAGNDTREKLPVDTRIEAPGVEPLDAAIGIFANGPDGHVLAAQGSTLVRIREGGHTIEPLCRFDDPIAGIHTTPSGIILVSTDRDHWDPAAPCRIFISWDRARSFKLSKEIVGGCALWWSFASSQDGTMYMGEYGPKKGVWSKTVWRSRDKGKSWHPVFRAPLNDNAHVHRVAVDPYTGDVWVTVGDGKRNRSTFRSTDGGDTWQKVRISQATAVAFTADGIYWGEDVSEGEISLTNRLNGTTATVLKVSNLGKYGGSVYDLTLGRSGRVYAPFMKYPKQDHIATVWSGVGTEWKLLLRVASRPGEGVGMETIAGPDRDGWLYVRGFRIRDGS
jgi:hypothetical protein